MFEQITLKDKNISEKALHLSLQKIYSHKQGNNHSLDRSEVAGSGKKLFKQKGTGNARAGNKKTTQRRGGGKAFGPKFHVVSYKVNKKVKKSAIVSSIVSKSNNKSLFVFDEEKLDVKNISDLLKKNPNEARNLCNKFRDFNSKGISASSDKAIEYVSNKKKLTPVNAEIFSIYVIGLHCPDII